MNEYFMEYVSARCEKALLENPEYMEMEHGLIPAKNNIKAFSELSCNVQARAEELCYIQGYNDAIRLMLSSKGA